MTLNDWKDAGKSFDFNGHSIFYRDSGEGEVVGLLHGFPTSSWDWHKVWPGLSQGYRLVAPDLLGFGWSSKPRDHVYSLQEQATLVESLFQSMGVTRAHLIAHDYGVSIAQELLFRSEERLARAQEDLVIASVCFLNGGIFPEASNPLPIQRRLAGPFGGLVARFFSEKRFLQVFPEVFGPDTRPTRHELEDFWTVITYGDGVRVTRRLIRYLHERERFRERWVEVLRRTHVPLRLVDGVRDPVAGAGMLARYRAVVPNPDVVVLDDVGHYPQLEAPDRVVRAFHEFMQEIQRKREEGVRA